MIIDDFWPIVDMESIEEYDNDFEVIDEEFLVGGELLA